MSRETIFGNTVVLKKHYVQPDQPEEGVQIRVSDIGRNVNRPYKIAELLVNMVNGGGCGRQSGRRTGVALHKAHRAIQMVVVNFLIGILEGLSENTGTDARNAAAIAAAGRMVRSLGLY